MTPTRFALRWQVDNRMAATQLCAMSESPSPYSELIAALRERLAVIADREWYQRDPVGHLARLQAISEQVVALQAKLPAPVDPQLAHYFQRCSYDKALAFLEDAAASTRA